MTAEELNAIRRQLLELREQLLGKLQARVHEAAGLSDEGVADLEDQGLHERLKGFLHLLGDRDREKVLRVDDALERIAQGTYGLCERCEKPIATARLKAQPDSRYCLDCQAMVETEWDLKNPGQGTL